MIVTYNDITDRSIGAHVKSLVSVPAPVKKVRVTELQWQDSAFYDSEGAYSDIAIPVIFSFSSTIFVDGVKTRGDWFAKYRALKKWLLSDGNGKLLLSDQAGYYYRVHNVEITSTERTARIFGEVTAVFYCDPYTYLESGDTEVQIYNNSKLVENLHNDHEICKPIYKITGSGTLTLTINGHNFTLTVNTLATIDTEKMLVMNADSQWVNITASGDYEDLWLLPGDNTWDVTATQNFSIYMTPQWRCL